MKYLFLALTILSILSQIPHMIWSIERYNRIKQTWLKNIQIGSVCSIISIGIAAFAYIGEVWYALGGAVVEIVINMYYYNNQFSNIQNPFRKHWLAYVLAVLLPMTIFIFSHQYSKML